MTTPPRHPRHSRPSPPRHEDTHHHEVSLLLRHSLKQGHARHGGGGDSSWVRKRAVSASVVEDKPAQATSFGWIQMGASSVAESEGDYGWWEGDDASVASGSMCSVGGGGGGGSAGGDGPMSAPGFRRAWRPRDSREVLHEAACMKLGLGGGTTPATPAGDDAATAPTPRAAASPATLAGAAGDSDDNDDGDGSDGSGGDSDVLRVRQSEPGFVVATRSFANLRLCELVPPPPVDDARATIAAAAAALSDAPPPAGGGAMAAPAAEMPAAAAPAPAAGGEAKGKGERVVCACAVSGFRIAGGAVAQHSEYQVVLTIGGRTLSAWRRYGDFLILVEAARERGYDGAIASWNNVQRARNLAGGAGADDCTRAKSQSLSLFLGAMLFDLEAPDLLVEFVSKPPANRGGGRSRAGSTAGVGVGGDGDRRRAVTCA